ncbi:hypothetical protein HYQ46_004302 [Verticillium longisporum]|nr:hypothetical protein HYQ46_004302 [Verticillium longisporum]
MRGALSARKSHAPEETPGDGKGVVLDAEWLYCSASQAACSRWAARKLADVLLEDEDLLADPVRAPTAAREGTGLVEAGMRALSLYEGALHGLLGRVNLGVPRGMARGGEGLLAAVAVPVAAGIPLAGAVRQVGGSGGIVIIRVGPAGGGVG